MKTCFVSIVDDNYIDSFLTLIYSVKKHNPKLLLEWKVFTNREWCSLNEDNRAKIRNLWPNTSFVNVSNKPYKDIEASKAIACFKRQSGSRAHNENGARTWFLKFHMLRLKDVDRIIYLDSDILCTGSIGPLAKVTCQFGCCIRKKARVSITRKHPKHRFNAGVMVIGKSHMNEKVHSQLVTLANRNNKNGDQEAWWAYLNGKLVYNFGKQFNRNPRKYNSKARLIHFWGAKSLERKILRLADKTWYRYYEEMKLAL